MFTWEAPPGPGVTGPGQLSTANPQTIFVQVPLINLTSQADKGFDATLEYAVKTQAAGHIRVASTVTVWNSYLVQEIPTENYYQYAGTASGGGSSSQGTIPRWRTYSTFDWKYDSMELEVGHTYIPSVVDIGPGGSASTAPQNVGSYQQFDLMMGSDLGKATTLKWLGKTELRLGVNNAFNRMPPVAQNAFPATNADVGDYNGPDRQALLRRGAVPVLTGHSIGATPGARRPPTFPAPFANPRPRKSASRRHPSRGR